MINQIRAFLLERGITFRKGPASLRRQLPEILENADTQLSPRIRALLATMWEEWKQLDGQVESFNTRLRRSAARIRFASASARYPEWSR